MRSCELLKSLVNSKGVVEIDVAGKSMEPSVQTGNRIRLSPLVREINIGDIIAYPGRRSGTPVLHRVIDELGSGLLVMGDNSCVLNIVLPEAIVGMATEIQIDGCWFCISCQNPWSTTVSSYSRQIAIHYETEASEGLRNKDSSCCAGLTTAREEACACWRDFMCACKSVSDKTIC